MSISRLTFPYPIFVEQRPRRRLGSKPKSAARLEASGTEGHYQPAMGLVVHQLNSPCVAAKYPCGACTSCLTLR